MKCKLLFFLFICCTTAFGQILEEQVTQLEEKKKALYETIDEISKEKNRVNNSDEDENVIDAKLDKLNKKQGELYKEIDAISDQIYALQDKIDEQFEANKKAEAAAKEKLLANLPTLEIVMDKKGLLVPGEAFKIGVKLKYKDGKVESTKEIGGKIDLYDRFDVTFNNTYKDGDGNLSVFPTRYISEKHIKITVTDKENPNLTVTEYYELDFNKSYTNNTLFRPTQGVSTVGTDIGHIIAIRQVFDAYTRKNYYEICFSPYKKDPEYYIIEEGNTVTFNIESIISAKDWDTRFIIIVDSEKLPWQDVIKLNFTGKKEGEYNIVGEYIQKPMNPLKHNFSYKTAKPIIR